MSDSSYIDHLLSSMLDRLAAVISNGGAQVHTDSVHTNSLQTDFCIKLDSSNLRLLKICGIYCFIYIITIVHQ